MRVRFQEVSEFEADIDLDSLDAVRRTLMVTGRANLVAMRVMHHVKRVGEDSVLNVREVVPTIPAPPVETTESKR